MRKRITPAVSVRSALEHDDWIDLEGAAEIEITSEDPNHPIEAALLPGTGGGWRASQSGKQTVRVLFDQPQTLRRIYLVFTEDQHSRTQEFVLRWSRGDAAPFQEIVRQQYNFSPASSEVEDYTVDLNGVRILELEIIPSISGGDRHASLTEFRLG
jgi:uncharacterized protein (DUF736 family)